MVREFALQIRQLELGTHACLIYATEEERNAAVVPFLAEGLDAGHRCVFMADETISDGVTEALRSHGVDLDAVRGAGHLQFHSERASYRRHGNFAPDAMLTMLIDESDAAAADGLPGFRASGEMTWPVDDTGETGGLMEYEARVNDVLAVHPVMALCLYDRTAFPPEVIVDVLRAHPVALVGNQVYRNLFYERPSAILDGVSAAERLDWMLEQLEESRQNAVRAVRLEAQLRQAQKMEAMGRLSSGVAHDFNNLLTAITGYASLVRDAVDPGSPQAEMLDEIVSAAGRGAEMTAKLLTFGRADGRREEPVDVAAVVRGLGGILKRLIPESIDLDVDVQDDLPRAWVDPNGLEQVILNLVVNARDAITEHGHITIQARTGVRSDGAPAVVVAVADDGTGIPEEIRDQIFEPFFTSKPVGEGSGLGLATAYGIVRQAGGEISVSSEPGAGSTFRVALSLAGAYAPPLAGAGPAEGETGPTDSPDRGSDPDAILVIEDEAPVRDLVERILTRRGQRVFTAAGRDDALQVVRSSGGELALVVSDVRLASSDGIEVLAEIRALLPGIPALVISGDTSRGRVQDLPDTGFLEKPFTADQLRECVDRALGSGARGGGRRAPPGQSPRRP